jgi:hydroxymethylpyrimidine/phosphomethylpyrimidine kinase
MPEILVIGGSDGSCGAGVFADHETLISLGSKAKFIVTSVTSQNDEVFLETHDVPSSTLESQFKAISFKDFDAIKIGMLPSVEAVQIVSRYLTMFRKKSLWIQSYEALLEGVCLPMKRFQQWKNCFSQK